MTHAPTKKLSPWTDGLVPLCHCLKCNALHRPEQACPVCHHSYYLLPQTADIDGVKLELPMAVPGAVPWSTYLLLEQIRLEAERPLMPRDPSARRPSQRLVIVILFWTLFETLMERFYEAALADLPGKLNQELLNRFTSIGSRLDRLHRCLWNTDYWEDVSACGYPQLAEFLKEVQQRRNAFIHGDPEAIDDELVDRALAHLLDLQLAWVAVFNIRCAGMKNMIPICQRNSSLRKA